MARPLFRRSKTNFAVSFFSFPPHTCSVCPPKKMFRHFLSYSTKSDRKEPNGTLHRKYYSLHSLNALLFIFSLSTFGDKEDVRVFTWRKAGKWTAWMKGCVKEKSLISDRHRWSGIKILEVGFALIYFLPLIIGLYCMENRYINRIGLFHTG